MVKVTEEYHITRHGTYKKNPRKASSGSVYLTIQRVPYAAEDTRVGEKEYWINGSNAGTISEWKEYAKKKGYYGLRIFEDGEVKIELV